MSIASKLRTLLEPEFAGDTAAQMFDSAVKASSQWIGAITSLIDKIPDDPAVEFEITESDVTEAMVEAGVELDTIIGASDGFTTVADSAAAIASGLDSYGHATLDSLNDIKLQLQDAAGNVQSQATGLLELVDSVKESMVSAAAAKSAIIASTFDSVADRLSKFETDMAAYIDTTFSGHASTLNYYKSLIATKLPKIDIIDQIFKSSGANELEAGDPITLADMDISQYTGANPLGAFSMKCFKDATRTLGQAVGAAVVGIWTVVKTGVTWLWNKASTAVTRVFSNPYDVIDSGDAKAGPCFTGFQYQWQFSGPDPLHVRFRFPTVADYSSEEVGLTTAIKMEDKENKWFAFKTLGGEVFLRVEEVLTYGKEHDSESGLDFGYADVTKCTIIAKPYPLAFDSISEFCTTDGSNPNIVTVRGDAEVIGKYLAARPGGSYLDTDASENDLANAFIHGWAFMWASIDNMRRSTWYNYALDPYTTELNYKFTKFDDSATVTNLDWLKIASGYSGNVSAPSFLTCPMETKTWVWREDNPDYPQGSYKSTRSLYTAVKSLFGVILSAVAGNAFDKSFGNYVPYTCNATSISTGRYSLKTDQANQNVANAFMTVIIAIVIVVAVVITGAVIAHKITRKLFWKRTEFIGQSDNAMWNGKSLSPSDRRRYLRYKRKLDGASALSSGLVGSSIQEAVKSIDLSSVVSALNGSYAGVDPGINVPNLAGLQAVGVDTASDVGELKRILK